MTSVPPFDYERAADLDSALAALGSGAAPVHGGTELLPAMGMGLLSPEKLVSVRSLPELRVCHQDGGRLVVGAGLTHRDIAASPVVRRAAPLLAEVADGVGNVRVRSTGTLGGNLAFAEPRSDVTTALLALDAEVRLASAVAQRRLPLVEFLIGPYEVDLQPGELIISVTVDEGGADFSVYRKIVTSERPVVGVALAHLADRARWRLVVGAVGLTPLIVEADRLAELDTASISDTVDVIRDLSGGEEYKRHLTAVTIERCRSVAAVFEREELAT
jgi:aerobic carbon-monoxide dehydrogenase medium subunit